MAHLSDVKLNEYIENSETCRFYKNKTLFITGVTGFCGKVLFEKIARVLFPVKRIYVLIRSKENQFSQDRLDELLKSKIFSFHQYSDDQFKKFVALNGDCSQPDMGLSDEDKFKVINEVHFVFHGAASVRFDAAFPYNFKQNTLGSKYMVDFIKKFKNIEHFVHVSTAFVNCQILELKDEISDFEDDIDVIIDKLLNAESDEEMTRIADYYYDGRPNSYILTKALAESYVKKHCSRFDDENNNLSLSNKSKIKQAISINNNLIEPNEVHKTNLRNSLANLGELKVNKPFKTYVVRPSIVYNSKAEPTVGWIDSYNGPSGFSIFIFLGLIRYIQMNFDKAFQCVPVDYLANALISIPYLYKTDQQTDEKNIKSEVKVITITYDEVKTFTILRQGFKYLKQYPSLYMLRVPVVPPIKEPKNTIFRRFKRYVYNDLWAHSMDILFLILGIKDKISVVRLHQKYVRAVKLMDYFVNHHFVFSTTNYKKLVKLQSTTDAVLFDFDFDNYDADQIASSYVLGTRRYLLQERDSTIGIASKKFVVQQYLSTFVTILYWIILFYVITLILRSIGAT